MVDTYVHKKVPLTFCKKRLSFLLSQALFSSYDIDTGTRMLLVSLEQRVDLVSTRTVLDMGCGTGILGICLKAANPQIKLTMADRDALALGFANRNCELNNIDLNTTEIVGGLDLQLPSHRQYDLIVSNLPAKAGKPVLVSMLQKILMSLAPEGLACIVVVKPLAGFMETSLEDLGAEMVHSEYGAEHNTYHFRPGRLVDFPQRAPLAPYIRHTGDFQIGNTVWQSDTVFGLPDFDVLNTNLGLAATAVRPYLPQMASGGRILFWNPGQGHLCMWLMAILTAQSGVKTHLVLASRDMLQLEISRHNVENLLLHVNNEVQIECRHSAFREPLAQSLAPGTMDVIIDFPNPTPGVDWYPEPGVLAGALLQAQGVLVMCASSTDMFRLLKNAQHFSVFVSKKHRGQRAVVLGRSKSV